LGNGSVGAAGAPAELAGAWDVEVL